MSSMATDLMYALREVPGKGKGLIATRKIPMGTRILSEEPIIRVPEAAPDTLTLRTSINQQVDALTPDQRQALLSMHNIHDDDAASRYLGIIRANALPFGDCEREAGIFVNACRINHDCDNNAQRSWNENINRHTVHAKRDIENGEEITIFYLGVLNNRKTRQEALRSKFRFTCMCRLCSLPPDQSQENDRKLSEILTLDGLIGRDGMMGILSAPLRKLRYVDQQIRLYNELGPNDNGLPRAFIDAAQIAITHGDLARARNFAKRAVLGWIVLEGDDGPQVLQYSALTQDPSKHELYGTTMKWKTAIDNIPVGLDSEDFDDWLWRRDKPKKPGQPVDLRNRTTFPCFNDLPDENDVDLEFYASSDGFTYRPHRHWLFLAEIVDFATLVRLQMDVKDVEGMTIPLFFYTIDRGDELAPSQVQKGYTIAILYAERHAFMFSEPGIRLEEPKNFKACQRTGWNDKGHKADCKLLRDTDLKGLFSLDWDNFEGHVQFPLKTATN
ncbi:hypothetical protein VE02_05288 [Pseudogymnoascus sp. 03VT05]|nr:hypothetical protein VE02_05288 [Pseudogymnoascus sp. 03VT05]